jgi:3-hydroxyacyl-CoA dehydrogenase
MMCKKHKSGKRMAQADIGLIGLGVMGSNLALNIAEKGNKIAVFNSKLRSECLNAHWFPCGFARKIGDLASILQRGTSSLGDRI